MSVNDLEDLKDKLNIGDHILTWGREWPGISHHGIYIGNNEVVHYQGGKKGSKAPIAKTSLEEFMGCSVSSGLAILHYPCTYTTEQIVENALSRLEESEYNWFWNNCESFATKCRTGTEYSYQAFTISCVGVAAFVTLFTNPKSIFSSLLIPSYVNDTIHKYSRLEVLREGSMNLLVYGDSLSYPHGNTVPFPYPLISTSSTSESKVEK